MSTRYVWGRNNLTAQKGIEDSESYGVLDIIEPANVDWRITSDFITEFARPYPVVYSGLSYTISNGKFVVSSATRHTVDSSGQYVDIWTIPHGDSKTIYFGVSSADENSFEYLYRIHYTASQTTTSLSIWLQATNQHRVNAIVRTSGGAIGDTGSGRSMTIAKGSAAGNVSNAASSTYPPCDAAGRITSICAVLPIIRRCYHGK